MAHYFSVGLQIVVVDLTTFNMHLNVSSDVKDMGIAAWDSAAHPDVMTVFFLFLLFFEFLWVFSFFLHNFFFFFCFGFPLR